MIEDETENRIVAANADAPQTAAVIEGIECRIEAASTFGPMRTVHRSYRADSLDTLGSVRRLHRSRDECRHIADQLRRVCDYYQEKETWWRNSVASIRMQHSEREHERNRILEASEVEWVTRYSTVTRGRGRSITTDDRAAPFRRKPGRTTTSYRTNGQRRNQRV